MSLPRRDVRFYLDADAHEALRAIAESEDTDLAALVEAIVVYAVSERVHKAKVIAERTADLVISPGATRKRPEL